MTRTTAARLIAEVAGLFRPPPDLTVTQWAEQNRVLSGENCALPGPYRVAVTPYLKEVLDCATERRVEKIVCMKSAQVAWTDGVINNVVGYHIDRDPAPMLILFPTDKLAERYSKEKLTPMVRDTVPLRAKVAPAKARDSGNTMHSKNFRGGHLELVASNSPANLSSSPIRVILVEEPDRCSRNSGGEGNSLKLAYERGKTFHNRKVLLGGSPTLEGVSEIEREFRLSDQRHYYIPCPLCGEMQRLEWGMVKWEKDPARDHPVFGRHLPETASLECKHCNGHFGNVEKNRALAKGEWRGHAEFNGVAGFFINELYSPFPRATLKDIVEKFLEADRYLKLGDPTLMITFVNTSLAETWKEAGDSVDDDILFHRNREDYGPDVPERACVLTAAADVQDDRIECEVVAWGPGRESWSMEHLVWHGDPGRDDLWDRLDQQLRKTYRHATGQSMHIVSAGVDTGGHYTSEAYRFVKPREGRGVFALKGVGGHGLPIVGRGGKRNREGVKLYPIGVDTAKQLLMFTLLATVEHGPGYCHFPARYGQDYFHQLTAEQAVRRFKKGRPVVEWEKKAAGRRNEALDLRVYNIAALEFVNLDKFARHMRAKALEAREGIPAPAPRWRRRVISKGVQL